MHVADASVEFNRLVTQIEQGEEGGSLTVTDDSGNSASFQAVVLTMPVPQVLQLQGLVQAELGESTLQHCRTQVCGFALLTCTCL